MALSITHRNGRETIVQVVPEPGSKSDLGMYGTGYARCHPTDMYDENVGEMIATGRGLVELGKQVENVGLGAVMTVDDYVKRFRSYAGSAPGIAAEKDPDQPQDGSDTPADEKPKTQVPEGIEKWVRENGFRLEKNDG
jgi:hypothetical protein